MYEKNLLSVLTMLILLYVFAGVGVFYFLIGSLR